MMDAGAKQTFVMEEPMAAAIGAGLNVTEPSGHMIVDIGGGTTDIAVISLGGLVVAEALRVAGDKFDQAIVRYVRKQYGLAIGDPTAEQIKVEIGSAYPLSEKLTMNVRGRDLVTGLPRTIEMTSDDAHEALMEPVSAIVDGLRSVLERTPPELAADIVDKGIVMTGGGCLLRGLDHLLTVQTGIPVYCADDPVACVAKGTGRFLEGMVGARMDQLLSKSIS
jgi:rod shape-determining protein MreB